MTIRLIDFGLSCLDVSKSEEYVGSMEYVSPEIISNVEYDPYLTDVYSFGILCFALIERRFPYQIVHFTKIVKGIKVGKYMMIDLPNLSSAFIGCQDQEIKKIITRCLLFDPMLRPTMLDLEVDLRNRDNRVSVIRSSV